MAMKKTSSGDSPLREGAGKSFWTLPIFGSTPVADHDVFWKSDRVLRFFPSGGLYRRRGQCQRWPQASSHHGDAARARAAPARREGGLWPLSYSPSDLWKLLDKIRFQELVSSNSNNISYVSLLKHKNSRKQGTRTVATC
jgi:hypothetical protein